jgi:hypothetical protein
MEVLTNPRISTERENHNISIKRMNKENIYMALMYNRSQKNSSQRDNFQKLFLKNSLKQSKEGSFLKSNGGFESNNYKKSCTNNIIESKEKMSHKPDFHNLKYEERGNMKKIKHNSVSSNQQSPKWTRNKRSKRGTKYRVRKKIIC